MASIEATSTPRGRSDTASQGSQATLGSEKRPRLGADVEVVQPADVVNLQQLPVWRSADAIRARVAPRVAPVTVPVRVRWLGKGPLREHILAL